MTALAATSLQHDLIFEEFGAHGSNPTEKFFVVFIVFLGKFLPRPAKFVRRSLLVSFNLLQIGEPRNASNYPERAPTLRAVELAGHDLDSFGLVGVQTQVACA